MGGQSPLFCLLSPAPQHDATVTAKMDGCGLWRPCLNIPSILAFVQPSVFPALERVSIRCQWCVLYPAPRGV